MNGFEISRRNVRNSILYTGSADNRYCRSPYRSCRVLSPRFRPFFSYYRKDCSNYVNTNRGYLFLLLFNISLEIYLT